MFKIISYTCSDIGRKRKRNEDHAGFYEPENLKERLRSGNLYVVADGLGGHDDGDKASRHAAAKLVKEYYLRGGTPRERLRSLILEINADLLKAAKQSETATKIASTIVAAVIQDKHLIVANVGDSRAYLLRNGKLVQITSDHSYVAEMVRKGAITEEEARQSKMRNRLMRSVGSNPKLEVDIFKPFLLQSGDTILLCSDGLTQYTTREFLMHALTQGTAEQIGEGLIAYANQQGGSDNITVSVIQIGPRIADSEEVTMPGFANPSTRIKTVAAGQKKRIKPFWIFMGGTVIFFILTIFVGIALSLVKTSARPTPTLAQPTQLPTLTSPVIPLTTQVSLPTEQPLIPTDLPDVSSPQTEEATLELNDCEYKVQANDGLYKIGGKFDVKIENIIRPPDIPIATTDILSVGEPLIIKSITSDKCFEGGGIVTTSIPYESTKP